MKRTKNKMKMKGCGTGQPSLSVSQLVALATTKALPKRCILCKGHPWSDVISQAIQKGTSLRGLFLALQAEGVTDVSFNTLRNHKATHCKDS